MADVELDISKKYQDTLGRAPTQSELASEVDNASRYGQGWLDTQLQQNLNERNASTNDRQYDSQSAEGNALYGSGTNNPNNIPGYSGASTAPKTLNQGPQTQNGYTTYNAPGNPSAGMSNQFNDPYTSLLENYAKQQLNTLTGPNQQTSQLMDFLNKRFGELSNSPGYSPQELAVLNTQALEPIEALRKASQQRELERTARAGYLPTSGITMDQQRLIDTSSDQARTAANRDLAINAINKRGADLGQAVQLGQMGMQIPQQQGQQALDVAGLLYNLPRQAMLDANTVINGSSPQSAITPYIQLMQQQQQAAQQQQAQQAAYWQAIANQIAGLFG